MPISHPTTALQQGMIFHHLAHPGAGFDIEQISIRAADLDADRLQQAFATIIARHPVLRSHFTIDSDAPTCRVADRVLLPFEHLQCSDADIDAVFAAQCEKQRAQPFELDVPPLMRCLLVSAPGSALCCWTFHHLLLDGRSFAPLLEELTAAYEGKDLAEPPTTSFLDYTTWLRDKTHDDSLGYWQNYLSDVATPCHFPVLSQGGQGHQVVTHEFAADASRRLEALAEDHDTSLNALLQTTWGLLLSHYTGEDQVTFGATYTTRHSTFPGAADLLGLMINTLPVHLQFSDTLTAIDIARQLTQHARDIRPHVETPLPDVLRQTTVAGTETLFNTAVIFDRVSLAEDMQTRDRLSGWQFDYAGQTNFPLALIAYGGERLKLRLEYAQGHVDDAHASAILDCFCTLLGNLLAAPDTAARALPLLVADAREARLTPALASAPGQLQTLPARFKEIARRFPARNALRYEQETLDYATLDQLSNAIAAQLTDQGINRGDLVGLMMARSCHLVAALIGILKTGAAYVPIDPNYPDSRVRYTLDDAQVTHVVTEAALAERVSLLGRNACIVSESLRGQDHAPDVAIDINDTAYVIYTSGSTGQPKGVAVSHGNVARLLAATQHWFNFSEQDRWTLFHSIAFDWSVFEIWGALTWGGELTVVPYWLSRSPADFAALLVANDITVLCQTPSAFATLQAVDLESDTASLNHLRFVIFGGEALDLPSLRPWVQRYGDASPHLINMYGITETTVHVTYRKITRADIADASGSLIGEPIPDLDILLLNEALEPVPAGVVAEIYVAGAGVARYLNRDALNRERFRSDIVPGTRLYRSGDLARWLPNGDLVYAGRSDFQVKIRGFRIELGEVEQTLSALDGVRQVVAQALENERGHTQLVAWYVGDGVDAGALRKAASDRLPAHMIPASLIAMPALPLTANGKIDLAKLPPPDETAVASALFETPAPGREQAIAALFAAILNRREVSRHDDFFALGGDSILSIKLISRARQQGLQISVRQIYDDATVKGLANVVATEAGEDLGHLRDVPVPMTPIQQWYSEHIGHQSHWNQAYEFDLVESVTSERLQVALTALCERHPVLGLRFDEADPRLHFSNPVSFSLTEGESADPKIRTRINELVDPLSGENLAVGLLRAENGKQSLYVAIHHLVVDGVSWGILAPELDQLLAGDSVADNNGKPRVDDVDYVFAAWARHLQDHSNRFVAEQSVWQELVTEGVTPTSHQHDCQFAQVTPLAELGWTGDQVADAQAVVLAAFAATQTGPQVSFDTESHGRDHRLSPLPFERAVGWFTAIYPVSLAHTDDPLALLTRTHQALARVPNNGIGFGMLQQQQQLGHSNSQHLVNFMGHFGRLFSECRQLQLAAIDYSHWRAAGASHPYAAEWLLSLSDDTLSIDVFHDSRVFDGTTIAAQVSKLLAALKQIIAAASAIAGNRDLLLLAPEQVVAAAALPDTRTVLPLTPIQELYLFGQVGGIDTGVEAWYLRYQGDVDPQRLRSAWQTTLDAHPGLRTRFPVISGGNVQQFADTAASAWESAASVDLQAFLDAEVRRGLDIVNGPLHRFTLITEADALVLVWTHHHLQVDGWSWPLILAEVASRYRADTINAASDYADYARWVRRERAPIDHHFWQQHLAELGDAGRMPTMATGLAGQQALEFTLEAPLAAALRQRATNAGISEGAIAHGAWARTAADLLGRKDICIGATFNGRPSDQDFTNTIGPFVTNLPLRLSVTHSDAMLQSVHEQMIELQSRQYHSSAEIQQASGLPWVQPMFESLLVFQNYAIDNDLYALSDSVTITELHTPVRTNFPLTIVISPGQEWHISLLYDTRRIGADFANDAATRLHSQLAGIAQRAELPKVTTTYEQWVVDGRQQPLHGTPAESATETAILGVWRELFGYPGIGVTDNFFDLGGRSIMVPVLMRRLAVVCGETLPVALLYRDPTVRGLARGLARNLSTNVPSQDTARSRSEQARTARQRARRKRRT